MTLRLGRRLAGAFVVSMSVLLSGVAVATPATDLAAVLAVAEDQIVTGGVPHHVVMWPSETEGHVDRENGKKADFAITMGNYLPSDLSLANVNVQVGKGLRDYDTGTGAVVGFRTPTGNVTIDTVAAPFNQGTMGTTDPGLAQYAAFPKEMNWDHLEDMRFLGARMGVRASGQATRSGLVYDHTDGNNWDVYAWRTAVGTGNTDITIALSPDRTLANYSCGAHTGTAVTFGKRSTADRDNLLETIVCNGTPLTRTNVNLSGCEADAFTACIQQNRFEIQMDWTDFQGNTGRGYMRKLGTDSADASFFDPNQNNIEVLIKVLDGTSLTGAYWVFHKATSNVAYDIRIRDSATNQTLTYHNPLGYISGGHLDVSTIFRPDGTGAASRTFNTQTDLPPNGTPIIHEGRDTALIGPCLDDGSRAKCIGNRFLISGTWEDFQGNTGDANVLKMSEQSVYFTFFDVNNTEVMIKVLDGRPLTPNFWVFAAGLTNVAATYTVIDKTTGNWYTQENPIGVSFPTNLDTSTILTASGTLPPESVQWSDDIGNYAQSVTLDAPTGEIVPFLDKLTFESVAPPDTTLEAALEKVHDNVLVVTQPDGSTVTVPLGLVAARPDFAGRIVGAEVYGKRAQWGPNGFGSAGGGFLKYAREAVTGATLRLLPSDAGVGYALAIDNNVTTLDPTIAHEYVRASFDGKTVSNEPAGVRYVTGFTTDPVKMDALKTIYLSGAATPQQVQSLMLIPHTTDTMACAVESMISDCDEYSGATLSLQSSSTEDLQVAGRFNGNVYLDIRQDEVYQGNSLLERTYYEDGHFSLSTSAFIATRPALADYAQFTNSNPGFFTLKVIGGPNGGSLFPEGGANGVSYSSILSAAPADWSFPLLPFD